jgi:hypothetical protein
LLQRKAERGGSEQCRIPRHDEVFGFRKVASCNARCVCNQPVKTFTITLMCIPSVTTHRHSATTRQLHARSATL